MLKFQSRELELLHRFAAFARSKPADEEYPFFDSLNCACGQFLRHEGALPPSPVLLVLNDLAFSVCFIKEEVVGRWGDLVREVENKIDSLTRQL